eukprot:CAMPEP_0206169494 /NCGR_PEP_ID=MMETSP1474-20131121/35897_1 /ASSEMBLY_ACC=CAM_ASM_001110 /TAXON_ID=97495 /ORGANISM="Imantonia sp., Strain RCC918" /LENGTH=72 /DNA_ID=CAMNT_0053575577 /DNA_START=853 /DNA_END=1072 /DNA_ORIENTATION=+
MCGCAAEAVDPALHPAAGEDTKLEDVDARPHGQLQRRLVLKDQVDEILALQNGTDEHTVAVRTLIVPAPPGD